MDKKKTTANYSTTRGGRQRLPEDRKRKMFWIYLSKDEKSLLTKRQGNMEKKFSEYLRELLLDEAKKPAHADPVDFLTQVSHLAREVNKLGVNVNQISKYVNQLILMDRIEPHIAETFNAQLNEYALLQSRIEAKLKEIMFI